MIVYPHFMYLDHRIFQSITYLSTESSVVQKKMESCSEKMSKGINVRVCLCVYVLVCVCVCLLVCVRKHVWAWVCVFYYSYILLFDT